MYAAWGQFWINGIGFQAVADVGQCLPGPMRHHSLKGMEPMDSEFEAQIRDLLANGRKIEAIKLYRDRTDAGLKEAKDAIEALERGATLPIPEQRDFSNKEDEIASLLEQGRKIEAIKLYRKQTGAGLKEAKDAVEGIALQREITMKPGCLGVVLVGVGLGLLVFT